MSTIADAGLALSARLLNEGYGSGAWHGPDLKAAISEVSPATAFWRPGPARHNIAEVALHHAFCARNVRAQLTGAAAEPFVLEGSDWFEVRGSETLPWPRIADVVEAEQRQLSQTVEAIEAGRLHSPLGEQERLGLVLGITCHAIYHAGQIQLLKRLHVESK